MSDYSTNTERRKDPSQRKHMAVQQGIYGSLRRSIRLLVRGRYHIELVVSEVACAHSRVPYNTVSKTVTPLAWLDANQNSSRILLEGAAGLICVDNS